MFRPKNPRQFPVACGASPTLQKYLATRAHYPKRTAQEVLAAIRGEPSPIKVREYPPHSAYNPRCTDGGRWVEDVLNVKGLRFVGFADEIVNIWHTGWFCDELQNRTLRGAVWQLPALDGCARYVPGYVNSDNDGAYLDFSAVETGGRGGTHCITENQEQACRDAARYADGMAERAAEDERACNEKWQAARTVEYAKEELARLRRMHTAAVRAIWAGEGDSATGARIRVELRYDAARIVREIRDTIDTYGEEILGAEYQ